MEVARHVLDTYFRDTPNPLVRHHLDSYRDLLKVMIPTFIQGMNPLTLNLGDDRFIKVYIGGKDSKQISYVPMTDEIGNAVLPHQCRLENKTYLFDIRVNIDIEYLIGKDIVTKTFEDVLLAQLPIMLKSSLCYISPMSSEELFESGECKFELGGYFIIDGSEKVLLTQERLAENIFYASKRVVPSASAGGRTLVEKETASKLDDATKEDKYEYVAGIRSSSEDGTKGPFSHFLILPPENVKPNDPKVLAKESDFSTFFTRRLVVITLPGFTQPVPLISVFYALGLTNDRDIYDVILAGIPLQDRTQYDELFSSIILSHEVFTNQEMKKEEDQTQDPNLLFLRRQTRTRSSGGVYINLYEFLFPHCGLLEGESSASFYRRKSYLLGYMTRIAMEVALEIKAKSNRDHLNFKRLYASGDLMFYEFRRVYKDVSKRMLTEMDTRIHFEKTQYADKKVAELVKEENIGYYWRSFSFMNEISKSFKGKWGGKDGISQELTRFSYLGTSAQLRRVNVDADKGAKIVEMRRINSSSWGMLCPIDNPDGGSIGLVKSMSILSSISTASSSTEILDRINKISFFIPISIINPSLWDPRWTKLYINSVLVGILEKTDEFHDTFIKLRRAGSIKRDVSLAWNRLENEYNIFCDAGRIIRPVYREGITESQTKKLNTWEKMQNNLLDYIDSNETDTLRISMVPFHPTKTSEIHGITILSSTSCVLPNSDHNPGTRNAFSCQQVKQACGWYNTSFSKRFDTISTWLNYAQRPLSQTWLYNHILGCLPYGENPIVALMVYSGYNQEDSILLNESSLKRGMFHTGYYHSYDIEEESLNTTFEDGQLKVTEFSAFGNVVSDPRYRDSVIKKWEGYNYDNLDSDGIIRQGSIVDSKTILVGMVTPKKDSMGQIIGYTDSSKITKRGQAGIVDAVYRYPTKSGLQGVKIRIAEHRLPVLGDKFSARHGQKGTVGLPIREEDMPYTSSGLRPDMIVNPHAFPSRMTIGMFIEMMATKVGVKMGAIVDSTPFSSQNRVADTKELLLKSGYHPYAHEVLYSGHTGEMMEAEIFMAPCYYIRSKLMVEDKINYRATGPKKLLTHQPVEGRSNDGGLRIGEMERDVLISHGTSKFINESLMERSDKTEVLFQPESYSFDANTEVDSQVLSTPYTLKLFLQELESMHISVKLASP